MGGFGKGMVGGFLIFFLFFFLLAYQSLCIWCSVFVFGFSWRAYFDLFLHMIYCLPKKSGSIRGFCEFLTGSQYFFFISCISKLIMYLMSWNLYEETIYKWKEKNERNCWRARWRMETCAFSLSLSILIFTATPYNFAYASVSHRSFWCGHRGCGILRQHIADSTWHKDANTIDHSSILPRLLQPWTAGVASAPFSHYFANGSVHTQMPYLIRWRRTLFRHSKIKTVRLV